MSDYNETSDTKSEGTAEHPPEKLSPTGISAMQGNIDDTSSATQAAVDTQNQGVSEEKVPVDYSRPSGFRDGVRDQVWDDAKDKKGDVFDPLTGKELVKDQPWEMGHKPGFEFKKLQDDAAKKGLSREKFLDIYNDPSFYRPELPSSNRCHKGEAGPDIDKWEDEEVFEDE